jgi:rhamnogalacturonyl hydrolase YesR
MKRTLFLVVSIFVSSTIFAQTPATPAQSPAQLQKQTTAQTNAQFHSPTKQETRQAMRRVADWQIGHMKEVRHAELGWVNATFYLGLTRWAEIAERDNADDSYYKWLNRLGSRSQWQLEKRMYHADDICVAQTWLALYGKYKRREMLFPTIARTEWVMANPSTGSFELNYSDPSTLERWTWCDALFMAPAVYLELYNITGDKKYLRFMDREFKTTYDNLFDEGENLFFRDRRYLEQREANGEKVFWGRGNGWVLGGLVELLKKFPEGNKYRKFYEDLFVKMSNRVAELQCDNGFWSASLLDPASYPSPETSATGFFVYALAYGVNEGLLSGEKFTPVVERGWRALVSAIEENGKLGYVQPVGADPKRVSREMTEVYGPGAFLLAGSEVYRMCEAAEKSAAITSAAEKQFNIDPARVREIAAMLPDQPTSIGVSYKNREFWESLGASPTARKLIDEEAPALLAKGFPPYVDSMYLHLNRTNVRLPGELMVNARYEYIYKLSLAECIENRGRYVAAIENALVELCGQNSWSIPAHDRNLNNFYGIDYSVDLVVATSGNSIALCVSMLGDRISPEVKARLQGAMREKIFRPVYRSLEQTKPFWWFTITNNWNSVCLAGVTGAALTMLPDKEERAWFVAAAEKYHTYGMAGYADDGYCSEGVGYWNYGFLAYVLLREQVCRATGGQVDFFRTPKFVRIARYGDKISIADGVCPAYSDCRIGISPDNFITDYCYSALGLIDDDDNHTVWESKDFSLQKTALLSNRAWRVDLTDEMRKALDEESDVLHTWYEQMSILVSRAAEGSECRVAISAKGGNNAENHNHNDVGSYTVAMGGSTMAGDQGGPFSYPGDYFAREAMEKYKIKGSFGHPVPVVGGALQTTGRRAAAVVMEKRLSDTSDVLTLDLSGAYPSAEGLTRLTRCFTYDRAGEGSFVVEDVFGADRAVTFETAITTAAEWRVVESNIGSVKASVKGPRRSSVMLTRGEERMMVEIESSGRVEFASETISVNSPEYTRIGIRLVDAAPGGFIRLKYVPTK